MPEKVNRFNSESIGGNIILKDLTGQVLVMQNAIGIDPESSSG
jgi:hypothetical protein